MKLIVIDGGNNQGSYGSYKYYDELGNLEKEKWFFWGYGDHTLSEYLILYCALKDCVGKIEFENITIFSDSETIVEQINGARPIYNKKLERIKNNVCKLLNNFPSWELKHVPKLIIKELLGH